MTFLPHIMGRLVHQPILCLPDYLEVVLSSLGDRIGIEPIVSAEVMDTHKRPNRDIQIDKVNGIAVVPLVGGMVHRSESLNPPSGMTGYTAIHNLLMDLRVTPGIRGIVLDVDSPGGEVSGCEELADAIAVLGREKPIYAVANGSMCSAAYWLCAGATRIYAAPNAMTGSIGVITAHIDRSKELEKKGQKVTLIHAGKNKAAGNPYEPLPAEVREGVQARVDALYSQFVATVSERRNIDAKVIRKTEAGVFAPEQALSIGLIDGVASLGDVLVAMKSRLNGPSMSTGFKATKETNMAEKLMYGEDDLAKARKDGETAATAAATAKAAEARAETAKEIAGYLAKLDGKPVQAKAFTNVLATGATPAMAFAAATALEEPAKEEAKTPADPNANANAAAVERVLAAAAPSVQADNSANTAQLTARERRLAEIASTMSSVNKAKGYR